jgi:thiol-disulfide isomerase/thioredoxin
MFRRVKCLVALALLSLAACHSSAEPERSSAAQPSAVPASKPEIVAGPTAQPVGPFVVSQIAKARGAHEQVVVYVGAKWCEPCQRFHAALVAGQLDSELAGVRFITYDLDESGAELKTAGYTSQMIPLFDLPGPDGRGTARKISGSIHGPGAVDEIMPRLLRLIAGK